MEIIKKIIIWILAGATLLLVYFSAYLPYAKSKAYIKAIKQAQQIRNVDEFRKVFDSVFNLYSPVGEEEVVKFLSNDILTLIIQEQAPQDAAKALIEYMEPRFIPENVRHMITGARMYEILWQRWGGEENFKKAEDYFLKAYAIGPKLPPVLYGMVGLYYAHRDFAKVKTIAEEILKHWPNDERVRELMTQLTAIIPSQ